MSSESGCIRVFVLLMSFSEGAPITGGEASCTVEALDVPDGGPQRAAGERTDGGDLAQLMHDAIGAHEGCAFPLEIMLSMHGFKKCAVSKLCVGFFR
jgi:hypothetical protein